MEVYKMNDCDWVIAHNKKQAIEFYVNLTRDTDLDKEEIHKCNLGNEGMWWPAKNLPHYFCSQFAKEALNAERKTEDFAGEFSYWMTFEEIIKYTKLFKVECPSVIS